MTKIDAEAWREKWAQSADLPACEHPNQELELSDGGYVTGNYRGTDCGELAARKP
ncbi:MAG TPA: hypothetical protein VLM19_03130 [Nitrospiraceae bacterium]|nr:hypothetical protein [Nitrospiraceae bacterium]